MAKIKYPITYFRKRRINRIKRPAKSIEHIEVK